jgi:glutathione S-transferase
LKFYNSLGPNPRLVRMFALEKGLELDAEEVDIMGGENRQAAYLEKNPMGELPCLELDDGSVVGQTVAICEYLDETQAGPRLVGETPEARAATRMWIRNIEAKINDPLTSGFRWAEGLGMFKDRRHCVPHAAQDMKDIAREGQAWLDAQLAGRDWIADSGFGLADIVLYCFLDFGVGVGQPIDDSLEHLGAWFARVSARESAEASLHPIAKAGGMRA